MHYSGKQRWLCCILLLVGAFLSLGVREVLAVKPELTIDKINVYQERDGKQCNFFNGCVEAGGDVIIHLEGIAYNNGLAFPEGSSAKVRLKADGNGCAGWPGIGYREVVVYNNYAKFTVPGSHIKGGCSYQLVVKIAAKESNLSGDDQPET